VAPEQPAPSGPSRDDAETIPLGTTLVCPVCQRRFTPRGRRRFCSDACHKAAWRRRHQPPPAAALVVPPARPRRPITVYACPSCQARYLGEQRCGDCGVFCHRVGLGGTCPHCEEPVAAADLIAEGVTPATT
jgi:hypothetical protein